MRRGLFAAFVFAAALGALAPRAAAQYQPLNPHQGGTAFSSSIDQRLNGTLPISPNIQNGTLSGTTTNTGTIAGGTLAPATPLAQAYGGTGCAGPVAYASLPASPQVGTTCTVTNAASCVAGSAISAGSPGQTCVATWNGSAWMPAGNLASVSSSGAVTSVSGVAPITSSGGGAPVIGISGPSGDLLIGQGTSASAAFEPAGGDCTISASGNFVCTKTNGTPFGPLATQATPCTIAQGCTGTSSPSLLAGLNISLSGSWPNQTIATTATPQFSSVTASGAMSANAISGTGSKPAITNFNGIVQGALNVMAYGATASTVSATATTTSGSTSVTLSSAGDFQNGQHVVLLHAGPATSLATPAAPTVKPIAEAGYSATSPPGFIAAEWSGVSCVTDTSGTTYQNANCTTSYTYQIVQVDAQRGMTAPSPATTITNGPATLSAANRVLVYWAFNPSAVETWVYGCAGASCTPTLRAIVPENPTGVSTNANGGATVAPSVGVYLSEWFGASGYGWNGWMDMGTPPQISGYGMSDELLGTALPSGATRQNLYTTISSGGGTTSLTLAAAPQVTSSSIRMWHDDSPAFQSAIHDACTYALANATSVPTPATIYVPPGVYQLGSSLSFYGCGGIRMVGSGGGPDLGLGYTSRLEWHGAGPILNLNAATAIHVERLAFYNLYWQTLSQTCTNQTVPSLVAYIDNIQTGSAPTAGGWGFSAGYANPSTDVFQDIYMGAAGVGIAIGWVGATSGDILTEKMQFNNVQMGQTPSCSSASGYAGYYSGITFDDMLRVEAGMVADREVGFLANAMGSAQLMESTNFENNVVDEYWGNTGDQYFDVFGPWRESGVYSEWSEHHFYSANLGSPAGWSAADDTVEHAVPPPNGFYIVPGAGGIGISGSVLCVATSAPCLVALSTGSESFPGRFGAGVLTSHDNVYNSPTPFYPAPGLGNGSGVRVVSTHDLYSNPPAPVGGLGTGEVSEFTANVNAAFAPVSGLTVSSLPAPQAPSVQVVGTAGSTTYTYYVACVDSYGRLTAGSPPGSTTTGAATLSTTNSNQVTTTPQPGCAQYYWWRNGTAASNMIAVTGASAVLNDVGVTSLNGVTAVAMPTATQQGVLAAASVQNGCSGSVALSSGTATVSNACITGSRPILVMGLNDTNHVYVSAMSAGSATIKSASSSDAATVYWSQN